MAIESLLNPTGKGGVLELLGGEELVLDAFREIVKDELKNRVRRAIDGNPELREELQRAIGRYFEAKVLETFAALSLAKAGAKVGLEALPDALREKLERQVASSIERELASVLQKAL